MLLNKRIRKKITRDLHEIKNCIGLERKHPSERKSNTLNTGSSSH